MWKTLSIMWIKWKRSEWWSSSPHFFGTDDPSSYYRPAPQHAARNHPWSDQVSGRKNKFIAALKPCLAFLPILCTLGGIVDYNEARGLL